MLSERSISFGTPMETPMPEPTRLASAEGSASRSFTRSTPLALRSSVTTTDGGREWEEEVPQLTPTAKAPHRPLLLCHHEGGEMASNRSDSSSCMRWFAGIAPAPICTHTGERERERTLKCRNSKVI